MRAETPGIIDVFQRSKILRIPFFQRQYVWEKDMWDRFLTDMDSLVGSRTRYFLGSLIFKEEEVSGEEALYGVNTKYSVVDGQQRLTTISLYLKALHSLIGDEVAMNNFKSSFFLQDGLNTPVLSHGINDRPAFQEVMWGNPVTAYEDKRVVQAYQYFYDALRQKDNKRQLLMAVYANIKFVAIILDYQDDEQQIFDTINSLGVDLTIDELMKNFLYEPKDEQAYLNNWKPAFDDKNVREFWGTDDAARKQTKSDENKTITNFFFDFVRIKMWDYRDKRGFDRKLFTQKSRIFNTCKAFHDVFGTPKQELADEIIAYSKLYHEYFNKKNLEVRIPMTSGIKRVACIAMASIPSLTPYLLYVLKNVEDITERNKIFGYLETYIVRRMVCFSADQKKNYTEFFGETLIGNRLDSYSKLKTHIENINSAQNMHMPSDAEITTNIHQRTYGSDDFLPRLFFYLQETANKFDAATGGYNYFKAENLMPKPSKANENTYPPHADDIKESQRKTRIQTLGNYILLHQAYYPNITDEETLKDERKKFEKDVKSHSNEAWSTKKRYLITTSQNIMCSQWLGSRTAAWSEDGIDERNRLLVKMINTKWSLN